MLRLAMALTLIVTVLPVTAQSRSLESGQTLYDFPPKPAAKQITVGVLLFPGFEMLDAYGPMELWGSLKNAPAEIWGGQEKKVSARLVTIAAQKGEVPSNQGPKTVAEYDYGNSPQLDFLLVPGGAVWAILDDQATLNWLRAQNGKTQIIMSVCNGASVLAASGLLDGRPATTNKMAFQSSIKPGPKVKWIKKARWVDDGTIVTSSGVSAGIDMTLAVISRLYGDKVGEWLEFITEYDAHRNPAWDPFAKKAGLVK
jgi:transcriptional regulator GlxA family with amidase domain